MNGEAEDESVEPQGPAPTARASAPDLRLGGELPRVMRLSRKAIGTVSAVTLAMIGGAFTYALQDKGKTPATELLDTGSKTTADSLAGAPKDYSQIPKLGPPLPGDLGGPILSAQQRDGVAVLPPVGTPPPLNAQATAVDAARQLAAQERDAARISKLFQAGGSGVGAATPSNQPLQLAGLAVLPENATAAAPTGKAGFLQQTGDRQVVAGGRLTAPVDPNVVQAGGIISAALITGIRSDLPGQITAQVTQNVYDSPTGRILLIPQGARLIGEYDADVSFGQNRVLLAWNRLILPDGRSILLDRQPGADAQGFAGLQDGVNYHWGSLAKAALISTVLGVGAELGSGSDDALTRALRTGTQDTINQSGQQIVKRQLEVRPTLSIRPGFPVRVIVTRDLILAPIGGVQ